MGFIRSVFFLYNRGSFKAGHLVLCNLKLPDHNKHANPNSVFMVAQPVSRMILFAALPAAAISYVGMPSLYWAHTENGLLCLRSNLHLRPPFYARAARHVRQVIGVLTRLYYEQPVNLRAELDAAINHAAGPILVRALSASAHGMQSEDAEPDCAKPEFARTGFARPEHSKSSFNVREL